MPSERLAVARAFGEVLRRHRLEAGLTQEALAARCGLHSTYVSQLERGLKTPSLAVLVGIADELGLRASELVAELERRL